MKRKATSGWMVWTCKDETEVEVTYTISAYDPGRIFGPPELCYPPEGGEVEILSVKRDGQEIELDEDEIERLILWLQENPPEEEDYD